MRARRDTIPSIVFFIEFQYYCDEYLKITLYVYIKMDILCNT